MGLAVGASFDLAVLGIDGLPGDNFSGTEVVRDTRRTWESVEPENTGGHGFNDETSGILFKGSPG